MSDVHANAASTDHDGPHEGPIKTPKQLVWTVIASFVVPIIVIILLTQFVATGKKPAAGSDGMGEEAVARRIQPLGTVELRDASDAASLKTGEQVFQAQCSACHTTGAAGAPKLADAAAWGPRITQGLETLVNSAIKGKGNMGPQGGGDFSDFEIARAVVYLANQGGAKFAEPKPPAAAASAAQ
ncbi:cytochrome c5 family protein [Ideonella sp.]|uniref:c-type cytochrome n=1 Tax=Ideonella sp. TaxID=1929293 RepID=UPI0035AFA853